MKKLTKFLLAFVIGITMSFNVVAQTAVQPTGSGTEVDPYQIAILDNLYWLSINDPEWSMHFVQTADIDASSTSSWNSGLGFSPIGDPSSVSFTGSYDGRGYYIEALFINRPTDDFQAMFGYTNGAEIKNIQLTDVNFTADSYVAGLVAWATNSTSVEKCFTTGEISVNNYAAGLVSTSQETTIENSFSLCNVSGNNTAGFVRDGEQGSIENCYSAGDVQGTNINGFIGAIGSLGFEITITSCYWDETNSGASSSAGGDAKTTAEMKQEATFTNWDFTNVWLIDASPTGPINDGYPYFNPAPPPPVPVSDWAIYFGIFLIAAFMVVRYRRMNIA